ncbi:MAG: hypothetical protein HFH80_06970 [Lachnospiraceae bacterium]|nr:hypothetical protein [Lachnospiraceae bacterium]
MKTKKMITLGILVTAACLGLFQPQAVLAAGRETGGETGAGMPDAHGGLDGNPFVPRDAADYADGDNALVVDSVSTACSEETPSIISVTAAVPEHFGLAAYAEVISVETGAVYELPLYAANGYCQRCYVPVGTYYVGSVAVYGDTKNEYSFDFPAGDFMVDEKDSFEITASLAGFESVDAEIREKRGETVEGDASVETDFVVVYSGTGNGQVGITGEQNGRYELLVRITESGYLGDGHFTYSLDGGETWQGEVDIEIPLSGFYEIPLTGLTVEFAVSCADADGFIAGDIYKASIPDPSAGIRCQKAGKGAAMVEVLSVDPNIQAFDALEASGMEVVIGIQKSGGFGGAVWEVSTDGGKTFSPQGHAEEELMFGDAGIRLRFYREKDGVLFARGDRYTVSAVRENNQTGHGLFIFLAAVLFGGLGYAAYMLDRKLKALVPKEGDYKICGRWTE